LIKFEAKDGMTNAYLCVSGGVTRTWVLIIYGYRTARAGPMKEHTYTLGIEEEFAIVDPETRQLRSHIQEILEGGKVVLKEQIKPEMHQSVVELGTEVCDSIEHARAHVVELRSRLAELAGKAGLKIASVGTHPFSHWRDQHITEGERYKQII